jgi:hypothetical protein
MNKKLKISLLTLFTLLNIYKNPAQQIYYKISMY